VSFDDFSGGNRMTARNIIDMGEARSHFASGVEVDIDAEAIDQTWLETFKEAVEPWKNGAVPVVVNYAQPQAKAQFRLGESWRVNPTDELMLSLETLTGAGKVRILF